MKQYLRGSVLGWALASLSLPWLIGCAGQQPIVDYVEEKKALVDGAEQMAAESYVTALNMAAQQYVLVAGKQPTGYTDFVGETNAQAGEAQYTTNVATLGRNGGCKVKPKVIDCATAFSSIAVQYHYSDAGTSTVTVTPKSAQPTKVD